MGEKYDMTTLAKVFCRLFKQSFFSYFLGGKTTSIFRFLGGTRKSGDA